MKNALIIVMWMMLMVSCKTSELVNDQPNKENYTLENLSIGENGLEGNIVIEVFDENMSPIRQYRTIIRENGKEVFDVPPQGHRSTFFTDGKNITIEIQKAGFKTIKTKAFETDEEMEMASFIQIKLIKE
ncbi:MAG: hypothetical protein EP305_12760 [Bacteroidetes bacterium]|nr:MAG: hypothetical protein EP305_12760 [Bacteroidota bacterium]